MTDEQLAAEHALFEAWLHEHRGEFAAVKPDGRYPGTHTQHKWECWLASAAVRRPAIFDLPVKWAEESAFTDNRRGQSDVPMHDKPASEWPVIWDTGREPK